MLTENFGAKIGDFGATKLFKGKNLTDPAPGTPGYMAPEATGAACSYNQMLDIYSFGCVMLFTISGAECTENIEKWLKCISPWPLLQKLAKQCLEHDPQERPTASEVCEQLHNITNSIQPDFDTELKHDVAFIKMLHGLPRHDISDCFVSLAFGLCGLNETVVSKHINKSYAKTYLYNPSIPVSIQSHAFTKLVSDLVKDGRVDLDIGTCCATSANIATVLATDKQSNAMQSQHRQVVFTQNTDESVAVCLCYGFDKPFSQKSVSAEPCISTNCSTKVCYDETDVAVAVFSFVVYCLLYSLEHILYMEPLDDISSKQTRLCLEEDNLLPVVHNTCIESDISREDGLSTSSTCPKKDATFELHDKDNNQRSPFGNTLLSVTMQHLLFKMAAGFITFLFFIFFLQNIFQPTGSLFVSGFNISTYVPTRIALCQVDVDYPPLIAQNNTFAKFDPHVVDELSNLTLSLFSHKKQTCNPRDWCQFQDYSPDKTWLYNSLICASNSSATLSNNDREQGMDHLHLSSFSALDLCVCHHQYPILCGLHVHQFVSASKCKPFRLQKLDATNSLITVNAKSSDKSKKSFIFKESVENAPYSTEPRLLVRLPIKHTIPPDHIHQKLHINNNLFKHSLCMWDDFTSTQIKSEVVTTPRTSESKNEQCLVTNGYSTVQVLHKNTCHQLAYREYKCTNFYTLLDILLSNLKSMVNGVVSLPSVSELLPLKNNAMVNAAIIVKFLNTHLPNIRRKVKSVALQYRVHNIFAFVTMCFYICIKELLTGIQIHCCNLYQNKLIQVLQFIYSKTILVGHLKKTTSSCNMNPHVDRYPCKQQVVSIDLAKHRHILDSWYRTCQDNLFATCALFNFSGRLHNRPTNISLVYDFNYWISNVFALIELVSSCTQGLLMSFKVNGKHPCISLLRTINNNSGLKIYTMIFYGNLTSSEIFPLANHNHISVNSQLKNNSGLHCTHYLYYFEEHPSYLDDMKTKSNTVTIFYLQTKSNSHCIKHDLKGSLYQIMQEVNQESSQAMNLLNINHIHKNQNRCGNNNNFKKTTDGQGSCRVHCPKQGSNCSSQYHKHDGLYENGESVGDHDSDNDDGDLDGYRDNLDNGDDNDYYDDHDHSNNDDNGNDDCDHDTDQNGHDDDNEDHNDDNCDYQDSHDNDGDNDHNNNDDHDDQDDHDNNDDNDHNDDVHDSDDHDDHDDQNGHDNDNDDHHDDKDNHDGDGDDDDNHHNDKHDNHSDSGSNDHAHNDNDFVLALTYCSLLLLVKLLSFLHHFCLIMCHYFKQLNRIWYAKHLSNRQRGVACTDNKSYHNTYRPNSQLTLVKVNDSTTITCNFNPVQFKDHSILHCLQEFPSFKRLQIICMRIRRRQCLVLLQQYFHSGLHKTLFLTFYRVEYGESRFSILAIKYQNMNSIRRVVSAISQLKWISPRSVNKLYSMIKHLTCTMQVNEVQNPMDNNNENTATVCSEQSQPLVWLISRFKYLLEREAIYSLVIVSTMHSDIVSCKPAFGGHCKSITIGNCFIITLYGRNKESIIHLMQLITALTDGDNISNKHYFFILLKTLLSMLVSKGWLIHLSGSTKECQLFMRNTRTLLSLDHCSIQMQKSILSISTLITAFASNMMTYYTKVTAYVDIHSPLASLYPSVFNTPATAIQQNPYCFLREFIHGDIPQSIIIHNFLNALWHQMTTEECASATQPGYVSQLVSDCTVAYNQTNLLHSSDNDRTGVAEMALSCTIRSLRESMEDELHTQVVQGHTIHKAVSTLSEPGQGGNVHGNHFEYFLPMSPPLHYPFIQPLLEADSCNQPMDVSCCVHQMLTTLIIFYIYSLLMRKVKLLMLFLSFLIHWNLCP